MVGVVRELVARVDAAFDALLSLDPASLDPDEIAVLVKEMHRLRARGEAAATDAVGAFDRWGHPGQAVDTAAWLGWQCRIRKGQAKREVSNVRALRSMPEVAKAYGAGEISEHHVSELAAAQRFAPKGFPLAESELLEEARSCMFAVFRRRTHTWRDTVEPDKADREAQDVFERRNAHLSQTFEDTWQESSLLDPVGGAIYDRELRRLERIMFKADWADARERLGDAATSGDLWRTSPQRRADAKVEMAKRSATLGNANLARPLISVLVDHPTWRRVCQLANGTVITPGQVAAMFTDADVERVVFGPEGRVIDLGRRSRVFVGGARRAVEVQDLECGDESCDEPAESCEVDHTIRWEHGGETNPDNGRLRCPRHHEGRRRPRP